MTRNQGKMTRIRKACDMCRARKVKCDEAGPPCKSCKDLGVECTYQYISRRRGPLSKYVAMGGWNDMAATGAGDGEMVDEADVSATMGSQAPSLPQSTQLPPDPQQMLLPDIPISSTVLPGIAAPTLTTDAIAPLHVLALLVDDFFTYIHPLTPFPHEPTFRRCFESEIERQKPAFLALLASMIGCLAASFPRSVRAHLKAQAAEGGHNSDHTARRYRRAICMVECCRSVALQARGATFYEKMQLTVDDAATSYFLGLAAGYTFQWHLCRRFMAEAMSFIQELGFHRQSLPTESAAAAAALAAAAAAVGADKDSMPSLDAFLPRHNQIEDQIGKRIFWVLFLAVRSMVQIGVSLSEIPLPPFNKAHPYPDLPAEVDDQFIDTDSVGVQPPGTMSLMTGFNKVVAIYATMDQIATLEYTGGLSQLPFREQKRLLLLALQNTKDVVVSLPEELYLPLAGCGGRESGDEELVGAQGIAGQGSGRLRSRNRYPNEPPQTTQVTQLTQALTPDSEQTLSGSPDYYDGLPGYRYYPPAPEMLSSGRVLHSDDLRLLLEEQPRRRRQVQYDIQKTNIYTSELATRSYYVEMYLNLRDAAGVEDDGADDEGNAAEGDKDQEQDGEQARPRTLSIVRERELIVHSLLQVLAAIPQCNMEPNGSALINKIRQVASTLLNDPPERKGPVERGMEAQLGRFLEILVRLEKTGGAISSEAPTPGVEVRGCELADSGSGRPSQPVTVVTVDGMRVTMLLQPEEDEEELQNWASLREEQLRFAASGGFLGH